MKQTRFKAILLISLCLLYGYAGYQWYAFANPVSPNIYLDDLPATATYVVKTDGTNYWAVRYDGYIAYEGTNASYVINNVVAANTKVVLKGAITLTTKISITVSYFILEGEGIGSTILTLADGVNDHLISITGNGVIFTTIRDMQLEGNSVGNSGTSDGIYINTPYVSMDTMHLIERVYIHDFARNGLTINGDTREVQLSKVESYSNQQNGFNFANGGDFKMDTLIAGANQYHGFWIASATGSFSNLKAFGNGAGGASYYGFFVTNWLNQFSNPYAQDNRNSGFVIYGSSASFNVIIGLISESNSKLNADVSNGLVIDSAFNNTIQGGQFGDKVASPNNTQRWGIKLTGTADFNIVMGAITWNNLQGGIVDASSGTNKINLCWNQTAWIP